MSKKTAKSESQAQRETSAKRVAKQVIASGEPVSNRPSMNGPAPVAPLTLEQRAQLGDKSAQAEIEAEAKFDELSGSEKVQAKLNGSKPKGKRGKTGNTGATGKVGGGARIELMGYPVTAVLRWMGKKGWTAAQAIHVCSALKVSPAPATVKIQVRAGAKGERGDPAAINAAQAQELNELRKSAV